MSPLFIFCVEAGTSFKALSNKLIVIPRLNLTDLTKQDGELVMMVKAEGQTVKSYKTRVTGGKLEALERSRVGFEPRADLISPRYVDLTDRSRSDFTMRDMFWVRKSR